MRLFVALTPPAELCGLLADWSRRAVPPTTSVRWIPARNLHLTVCFLGDVEAAAVAAVGGVIGAIAARHRGLRLVMGRPDVLPPRGPARVACIEVERAPALRSLQAELAARLEALLGIAAERRPYRAHLTLARCRPPWDRATVESWRGADCPYRGCSFAVTYVDLMESLLRPGGVEYRAVERLPLAT